MLQVQSLKVICSRNDFTAILPPAKGIITGVGLDLVLQHYLGTY